MTRRSFISDMLKVGIATTFLPGAGRIWKPTYKPVQFVIATPNKMAVAGDLLWTVASTLFVYDGKHWVAV